MMAVLLMKALDMRDQSCVGVVKEIGRSDGLRRWRYL